MGKKTVLSTLLTMCLLLSLAGFAFASGFSDIQGHWAEKQINKWAEKGLASGYADGAFKPDREVTRAEFVTLVNRSFGFENRSSEAGFADVKPGQWYYSSVAAAKAAGYISGYPDGSFRPDQTITRQEVAVILVRLLGLEHTTEGLEKFKDSRPIPAWSRSAIGALSRAGLISGYPDGTFKAERSITRAESLASLDRAVGYKISPVTTIEGTVTLNGKAADKATVRVFIAGGYKVLKEAATDSNGKFKVDMGTGNFDITAVTENEVAYAGNVKITGDKATAVNLNLTPAAVVSGVLQDKDGNALKNTALLFTTNPAFVTRTDQAGKYIIQVLPNQDYRVRSYEPGKEYGEPVVVISALKVGSAGKHDAGALKAPFSVSAAAGGGGGGGAAPPSGPVVLSSIGAGTYSDARGYIINSFGTFGPADGQQATFTSKLTIDPGDNGTLTLRNLNASNIEVLSGGKQSVKTINTRADKLVAKSTNGVKIEAGEGTVITETEVQGETHIAVAQGVAGAGFGQIKIRPGAGGKSIEFSGNLANSTIAVETGDVTLKANAGVQMGALVIEAPGAINLGGQGSFGVIEVSKNAVGPGGRTPSINVAQGVTVSKLVLSATVELSGDVAGVVLEVTSPDVQISVDQSVKSQLLSAAKVNANAGIGAIKTEISLDDESIVVSARNKVNAFKALGGDVNEITQTAKLENAEEVIKALKLISITYGAGDNHDSVTKNISLPAAADALSITWTSNNSGVVGINGAVTRPVNNVNVTLTATITKGVITGKKSFPLTVRGGPRIISFAGAAPGANNTIEVPLNSIKTTTGIVVSVASKLALNVEGLGAFSQLNLKADTVNNIYNVLIPKAEEIDLSKVDLNRLFAATSQCPPATKKEIIAAVNFTGLFDVIKSKPGLKESIIDETNLGDLLEAVKNDNNIVKGDILKAVDISVILDAVRNDGNISKNDILNAVQFSELMNIVMNIKDEDVRNELLAAVDIIALSAAKTKEDVFKAVNFVALFNAINKTSEATKDAVVKAINFTALFDLLKKSNSATKVAFLDSINFTSLAGAVAGASKDTIDKFINVTIQTVDIMRTKGVTRSEILNNIRFNALSIDSIFDWLKGIDGDKNVLTIAGTLTDNAGSNNTYTINIRK